MSRQSRSASPLLQRCCGSVRWLMRLDPLNCFVRIQNILNCWCGKLPAKMDAAAAASGPASRATITTCCGATKLCFFIGIEDGLREKQVRESSICRSAPNANRTLPYHQKGWTSLGMLEDLWGFMPVRLTLCDLRAPGWVEPWFPLRVVLFLSHVCVWQCYFLVLFVCFGFSRHTNPSDDAKVIIRPTVPARSPCHFAVLCVVVFFFFVFVFLALLLSCFCLVLFYFWHWGDVTGLCIWSYTGTAIWAHLCTEMADIINQLQWLISFMHQRVDRPGES